MNVRLVLERKRKRIWAAQLRHSEATLGRASGCTVRIPSSQVSRLHCRLHIENGLVFVEDLESVNGTFINGERVHRKEIVHPGDRLRLGVVTFLVEYELSPEAMRRLGGEEDFAILEGEDELEVVEEASSRSDSIPLVEPVEEVEELEEVGAEMLPFDQQEDMQLPEGGDLRDFLIELDDTDESSKSGRTE